MGKRGYTIFELVLVLFAIVVLSVAVSYKYFSRAGISSSSAYEQLLADIRALQIIAMGGLEKKTIEFSPGSAEYTVDGEKKRLPGDSSVTSTNLPSNRLTFNTLGEPEIPGDRYIELSGGKRITIYALTGRAE